MQDRPNRRPLIAAGTLLGVGMGGFVDRIVFHHLLQAHHRLSARLPGTSIVNLAFNMLWDGLFHASTWVLTLAGTLLLVQAWQRGDLAPPYRAYAGLLLAGWGVFNVVEGTIDHLILGIHHVRDDLGGPLGWDLGFLAFGALLAAVGWRMAVGRARP